MCVSGVPVQSSSHTPNVCLLQLLFLLPFGHCPPHHQQLVSWPTACPRGMAPRRYPPAVCVPWLVLSCQSAPAGRLADRQTAASALSCNSCWCQPVPCPAGTRTQHRQQQQQQQQPLRKQQNYNKNAATFWHCVCVYVVWGGKTRRIGQRKRQTTAGTSPRGGATAGAVSGGGWPGRHQSVASSTNTQIMPFPLAPPVPPPSAKNHTS
ncbi:hypothetical protein niasHT_034967 [Heterodera trifolii]|uniref:Uncharacterized protein n=1 Tax=Heterodera trifolii TaxID=157864 RepID=A0ABD2IEC7_9BILA